MIDKLKTLDKGTISKDCNKSRGKRLAFDVTGKGAITSANLASYVLDAGENLMVEEAITPFEWRVREMELYYVGKERDIVGKEKLIEQKLDYMDKTDPVTTGSLMMAEQLLNSKAGQRLVSLQILPKFEEEGHKEGRAILMIKDFEEMRAKLYGFQLRMSNEEILRMAARVVENCGNPIAICNGREAWNRVRSHSFVFESMDDLAMVTPELARVWTEIVSGRAQTRYDQLQSRIHSVKLEIDNRIDGKMSEVQAVRVGGWIEDRLQAATGIKIGAMSGCGISNKARLREMGDGVWLNGRLGLIGNLGEMTGYSENRKRFNFSRHKHEKLMDSCGACKKALYRDVNGENLRGKWLAAGDNCPHCKAKVPKGAVEC